MASLLFIAGAAAIVAGCVLIYFPAGLIVGGVLLAWMAWSAESDESGETS